MVDLHCCVHFCCTTKWFSYTYIHILFSILFHCGLSQDIEYSFLCYTVGPCCLSILHTLWILLPLGVCLCAPQAPHVSFLPPPPPFGNHVYSHVCESASVSQIGSLVSWSPHMRDTIRYLSFSSWLTSITGVIFKSIQVASNDIFSFSFFFFFFWWLISIGFLFFCLENGGRKTS